MLKKRKRLKSLIIVFIVIIIIIGCVVIVYNQFIKSKEKNTYSTQLNLKNISELAKNQLKDIKNQIKENKAESLKEETDEQKIIEDNNSSNSSNNSSSIQNNTNANTSKNNNNKQPPSTHNSNSSSGNQSKPPVEQTPSCIPKKFYTTFRADFSSEAECEAKYNYYHNIDPNKYLGFICSYQTDDCGVTYYMLTFFDSNGHYFGYNEI